MFCTCFLVWYLKRVCWPFDGTTYQKWNSCLTWGGNFCKSDVLIIFLSPGSQNTSRILSLWDWGHFKRDVLWEMTFKKAVNLDWRHSGIEITREIKKVAGWRGSLDLWLYSLKHMKLIFVNQYSVNIRVENRRVNLKSSII